MSLRLDPRTTALVLIDLQAGLLAMPLQPYDPGQILATAGRLGRSLREAGGTIVLVRIDFAPGYADRPPQLVDAPMMLPAEGPPTGWSTLAPDMTALEPDVIITKRQWSAFFGTELDLQLRRRGITTIVLGGIATNFGVESTARDAWQHNYAVVVAEDASTSLGDDLHRFSIEKVLPRVARVRSSEAIIAALQPA